MAGKTCLVTGATAGIGLVTARELARLGATVVIVGRSRERCDRAVESIRRDTSNPAVEFLTADLSSQAAVRRLAREYEDRHSRLHVLVNNAGALFASREETADGIEKTLALNHLAYFLLTTLLLDTLLASAPARVVNVSSHGHEMVGGFDFDDPQARHGGRWSYGRSGFVSALYTLFAPTRHPAVLQYARTKLANLLFTYELARRLEGTGVTVNALHPGFVSSSFMAGNGTLGWFMRRWVGLFGVNAEEGAKTSIYLATSPEVAGVTGKHFARCRLAPTSPASMDEAAARKLWDLSEALTGVREYGGPT
jgi:NAD(P)-dependent dehydrogenase (short-subunit alcohol dehydrogenase family)